MELRQLRYFKEACELRNFSEAARVLHISQSTLSQQIKQLEEELDVLLFDRIGKRVVPTEAGKAFLPFACKSIKDAEDGCQIIRDLKGVETGTLCRKRSIPTHSERLNPPTIIAKMALKSA